MNDEVKERFKSTFEAIRESFKVTFKQMFGGGQADLILTEGDLLTAGVEISVQPQGKKIQSLNLMSGGEKLYRLLPCSSPLFVSRLFHLLSWMRWKLRWMKPMLNVLGITSTALTRTASLSS